MAPKASQVANFMLEQVMKNSISSQVLPSSCSEDMIQHPTTRHHTPNTISGVYIPHFTSCQANANTLDQKEVHISNRGQKVSHKEHI